MAKIGLRHIVYKTATAQGVIAEAIQADIAINLNNERLYGDDVIVLQDNSFVDGTITLGTSDLTDAILADLLGHTYTNGELTANIDSVTPFCGVGFFGVRMVDDVKKYRAIWLPKIMFGEPEGHSRDKDRQYNLCESHDCRHDFCR